MAILIDLLNLIVYLPFRKVQQEDIVRNINHLTKYEWFQNFIKEEQYRKLIIHDKDVRKLIGKFNNKKMERNSYRLKCQEKLYRILLKS
ncbi:tmRNA-binding protein [Bacillus pakistanensis]|uniref:TmRNA-binding protein n=1 Tax=Rossellomorea pakistanensis TaxID=992288 RepID=A0ABS2NFA9_9BACI|nr:hypothetical protein [Bacillus pakistanensis]MBM7586546.1 tmRNA-binding protein [Bacillus pakistanensis]